MPENQATRPKNGANGSKSGHTRNTGAKLVEAGKATQFKKGHDPRRNLNGRPRSFDEVRALAQELANEDEGGRPAIENVLRRWKNSIEPTLQKAFVEYAFGKVPDKIDATMEHKSRLYLNYSHEESNVRREDHSRISPAISPGAN